SKEEARRLPNACRWRDSPKFGPEHVRVVGCDDGQPLRPKTQPGENGLREFQGPCEGGDVVPRTGSVEDAHGRCTIGKCGSNRLKSELRNLVDGERQHVRW